jgi:hypothetical protein
MTLACRLQKLQKPCPGAITVEQGQIPPAGEGQETGVAGEIISPALPQFSV